MIAGQYTYYARYNVLHMCVLRTVGVSLTQRTYSDRIRRRKLFYNIFITILLFLRLARAVHTKEILTRATGLPPSSLPCR